MDGAKALVFHRVASLDRLEMGYGSIPAPVADSATEIELWGPSDLVLVPGLAFDALGGRIGSGKGFYDRFLGGAGAAAMRWGVCWRGQVEPGRLPQEAHDIRMQAVVTDGGWIGASRTAREE